MGRKKSKGMDEDESYQEDDSDSHDSKFDEDETKDFESDDSEYDEDGEKDFEVDDYLNRDNFNDVPHDSWGE